MSTKPTGLDWGAVTEQYVARGGELQPEVWGGKPAKKAAARRPAKPKPVSDGRGRQRALSDSEERELAKRYADGETSPALAKAYGFGSAATVRKIVRRRGGQVRTVEQSIALAGGRSPLTAEQEVELLRRYNAGESAEAMAKELGTTPRSARRAIVRQGGTIRSRSEATRLAKQAMKEQRA